MADPGADAHGLDAIHTALQLGRMPIHAYFLVGGQQARMSVFTRTPEGQPEALLFEDDALQLACARFLHERGVPRYERLTNAPPEVGR